MWLRKPLNSGWYWWRIDQKNNYVEIVHVVGDDIKLYIEIKGIWKSLYVGGYWWGPLGPPKDDSYEV